MSLFEPMHETVHCAIYYNISISLLLLKIRARLDYLGRGVIEFCMDAERRMRNSAKLFAPVKKRFLSLEALIPSHFSSSDLFVVLMIVCVLLFSVVVILAESVACFIVGSYGWFYFPLCIVSFEIVRLV